MTSFAAWAGVDSRGMSSFYFASDSRISWGISAKWDAGRKLFASSTHPDIFGYCGDVLFPSLALSQVVDLVDHGLLFVVDEPASNKFQRLCNLIAESFELYPICARRAFTIAYCSRIGVDIDSKFELYTLSWSTEEAWKQEAHSLPSQSQLVLSLGSGKESIKISNLEWQKTPVKGTSRAVFGAFCDSLKSNVDPLTGGAPQLVGLYRKDPARTLGVIYERNKYLFGLPANQFADLKAVEWRNELFELCDPCTMARLTDAQPQPRPRMS
jgi:hypothetical protein